MILYRYLYQVCLLSVVFGDRRLYCIERDSQVFFRISNNHRFKVFFVNSVLISCDCDGISNKLSFERSLRYAIVQSKYGAAGQIGKLDSVIKNQLFKAYCSSFYGCEIWDLNNTMIESLCIAWRKGARRVWLLPSVDQLRVVASSTSNDPGPRSRQHQQIGHCLLPLAAANFSVDAYIKLN